MRTTDFDFVLPPELIAQQPLPQRDQSRLLVLHRHSGRIEHRQFPDVLYFFRAGDVLVLNDTRVIPARLRGVNAKTGGAFEVLLLEEIATNDWWAMLKPGKRARLGTQIRITPRSSQDNQVHSDKGIHATVIAVNAQGHRRLHFTATSDILAALDDLGEVPLPPYIRRAAGAPNSDAAGCDECKESAGAALGAPSADATPEQDRERYQTIFAQSNGSVAAPTAGLHFTANLLTELRTLGVEIHFVTLHVGLGTFVPVKTETLAAHVMHEERYEVSESSARAVNEAKAAGRRVIAVGTTSVRVLESVAAQHQSLLAAGPGRTKLFIHPPQEFRIVDALLTNFHLPRSTLLMLVSALASPGQTRGRELVLSAYAEAIRERYRFFSYGDAMLVL